MLLYRAAAAHNLPVMCHAIATGAAKNWKNPNDNGRTSLFQAILSVIFTLFIQIHDILIHFLHFS